MDRLVGFSKRVRRPWGIDPVSKKRTIFVDHCVWDFLFERGIALEDEFPASNYSVLITREAEFEINTTPEPLKSFIQQTIVKCDIATDAYFGFQDDSRAGFANSDSSLSGFPA